MSTIQGLRGSHVKHVYDLTFLYVSPPPRGEAERLRGRKPIPTEDSSDDDALGALVGRVEGRERVPSLAEQLGCADIARAGYKFRVHVQR